MSEIERVIEILERDDTGAYEIFEKPSYVDLLLKLLRAELDREKNPLTCDGCHYEFDMLAVGYCSKCNRLPNRTDRYEPKGEKA